jgi:hypothetical protein
LRFFLFVVVTEAVLTVATVLTEVPLDPSAGGFPPPAVPCEYEPWVWAMPLEADNSTQAAAPAVIQIRDICTPPKLSLRGHTARKWLGWLHARSNLAGTASALLRLCAEDG